MGVKMTDLELLIWKCQSAECITTSPDYERGFYAGLEWAIKYAKEIQRGNEVDGGEQ